MSDLKELLGEELFKQVQEKVGDNKIAVVSDGNWIPKSKFDTVNEQKNTYKAEIDTQLAKMQELEKGAKGNDELLKQLDDFKVNNEQLNNKIKDIKINSAIKLALIESKAKYPDLLASKIDREKITFNDKEEIVGLNEQMPILQESYKDLFQVQTPPPTTQSGNNPQNNNNVGNTLQQEYTQAVQSGNLPLAISLKNKIFNKNKEW